jgi:hypothetical protein
MNKWKRVDGFSPHFVLEGDGFYVSYNKSVYGGLLSEPTEETALVKEEEKDDVYYILNGDFRKEYEKLASRGFEACLRFFKEKEKHYGSEWSTFEEDEKNE